jgi:hypothetical protein
VCGFLVLSSPFIGVWLCYAAPLAVSAVAWFVALQADDGVDGLDGLWAIYAIGSIVAALVVCCLTKLLIAPKRG